MNMEAVTSNRTQGLSPFQMEMLEMTSRVSSQQEMDDIRRMLAQYFARKAEDAIDNLWDNGTLSNEVIEGWKNEHMRTHYRQ